MSSLFDCSGEVAVVIGATGVLGGSLAEGRRRKVRWQFAGAAKNEGQFVLRHSRSRRHRGIYSL